MPIGAVWLLLVVVSWGLLLLLIWAAWSLEGLL